MTLLRLTVERKDRNHSQSELSRLSGLHPTTISLIESGRFLPSQGQLERLSKALRFPGNPEELLEGVDVSLRA